MKFSTAALALSSLAAVQADGYFPYLATASVTGTAHFAQASSMLQSLGSSLGSQPAYSSFIHECESTIDSLPTAASQMLDSLDCDPVLLAQVAANPTTTPVWVTQLPSDMQAYISSVDAAIQSVAQKVNGNVAGGLIVNVEAVLISVAMGVLAWL